MSVKNDQFYTNPDLADVLVKQILKLFPDVRRRNIIEPSAGSGNFVYSLIKNKIPKWHISAFDIDPKDSLNLGIKKANYLKKNIVYDDQNVVIGNPPFGKRGKLALEFLNKALSEAPIVCFILPNIFNRYSVQKSVEEGAKLIYSASLEEDSFLVNDAPYGVKCTFQIWVKSNAKLPRKFRNKRLQKAPEIRHKDFDTFIYNNTKETRKYFNKEKYGWDIAVVRQGFYDYKKLIVNPKELNPKRQYIFIKYKDAIAKKVFSKIDFHKLSLTNTQVPGFSTTDLVREYKIIKKEVLKNDK